MYVYVYVKIKLNFERTFQGISPLVNLEIKTDCVWPGKSMAQETLQWVDFPAVFFIFLA